MIQDKKLQTAIDWHAHDTQETVLACDAREVIICAGRGWGKSMLAAYIVFKEFIKGLARLKKKEVESIKIFIVAPTYGLCDKVFNYVVKFLLAFDKKAFSSCISGRIPQSIKFSQDAWIECRSTEAPTGLLGERIDLMVVDEAPLTPEKIYQQYLLPVTVSSAKKGKTYYIGTPRGRGWFKNKFTILKEINAAFKFKSTDGVEVTEEELLRIKKEYPISLFEQEYMAEFRDDAGMVFKKEVLDKIKSSKEEDAIDGHHYIMGVDLAKEEDYTVITVIDSTTKRMVHMDRFKGWDYPYQKTHIQAKAERYNSARVVIDATGVGKPIYEDLMRAGVFVEDFTFSGKSKEELFSNLRVFIENGYITIIDNPVLIDELLAFEYKLRNEKTGEPLRNIKYGPPQGLHDDCVDSLALAVWDLAPNRPKVENKMKEHLKEMQTRRKPIISDI